MLSKVWNEITYPFPNFNRATIEVWESLGKYYFLIHFEVRLQEMDPETS